MNVAELVRQQIHVAVLERDDVAEVGRLHDRRRRRRQEADVVADVARFAPNIRSARASRRGRPTGALGHTAASTSVRSRSAWSVVISASINASRSPSSTPGMLWTVSPMRWSVTRSCGKLYVR